MSAPPPRPPDPRPRAVIVGAGLAGLSAAVRLHAAGVDVRVLDPEPPGGKARTLEPAPGWRIEWGPHTFLDRAHALWTLAEELGVTPWAVRLGATARARFLVRGGRLLRAPGRAFSLSDWFAVARGVFRRVPDVPGESVFDWFSRRFGVAFARGPIDAMMTGIWASDPADIEMDVAFPTVAGLVRAHGTVFGAMRAAGQPRPADRPRGTYGFSAGMGTLAQAAVARLGEPGFHLTRATGVTRTEGGYRVATEIGPFDADMVVLAVEAPVAARLVADVAPAAVAPLGEVRYAPLAVAHWTSPDAAYPRGFGFLAAHQENRPVLGTIFASDLYPDRAPAGLRAFTTMLGGSRRPDDARIDAQEARRRLLAEHRALTGRDVTIADLHLVHHPAAVAPPRLGHTARVAAVRAALPAGVAVAGAWCGAGAMDDAVASGFAAAEALDSFGSWGGGAPPRNAPPPSANPSASVSHVG